MKHYFYKILGISILGSLLHLCVQLPSKAETTIERIQRTGVIRAGAWQDAKPFGYVNENDEWVGYSIDILTVIQNQLGKALKQSIKLELVKESLLFFSKILGINNSYQR